MEEIKCGEYVRDEEGYLGKCTSKYGESVVLTMQNGEIIGTREYEKYKHSFNIIDLIEVGDYVNGEPVEQVTEFEITTTTEYLTNLNDIKSIVTKEQLASVEYKLDN